MTTTKIAPQTCHYINLSTLANISKETNEAVQALLNSDIDVSFGDANRTLIDIPHFLRLLEDGMEQQAILWVPSNIDDDEIRHDGWVQIVEALEEFDTNTYIDLEN
jgi:hypothetical protein